MRLQNGATATAQIGRANVEGVTVEGVVDLAFPERVTGGERWVVVDFKTDADIAGRLDEYRVQLAALPARDKSEHGAARARRADVRLSACLNGLAVFATIGLSGREPMSDATTLCW